MGGPGGFVGSLHLSYAQYVGSDDNAPGAAVVNHAFGFGAMGPEPTGPAFFPDIALAIGYEF